MSEELERECDERNQNSKKYIEQHYGSGSPRRNYHWEVEGNELVLVEE